MTRPGRRWVVRPAATPARGRRPVAPRPDLRRGRAATWSTAHADAGRLVRLQRLPRADPPPGGGRRRPRRPRPLGRRCRVGPAGHRRPPGPRRARGGAGRLEGDASAALLFPTGFAANLAVLTTFGTAGVAHRARDELNHASIIDGCRLARAEVTRLPPRRRRPRSTRPCWRRRRAGASSSPTPCSRWTATWRRSPTWRDLARRHGALLVLDEAHAVLGPDRTLTRRGLDVLRVGTLSKTLGSLGGFVAGPRAARRPAGQPGPAVHLHHRTHAGRRRRRPRRPAVLPLGGG